MKENEGNHRKSYMSYIELILHISVWSFILIFPQMTAIHVLGEHDFRRTLLLLGDPLALAIVFYANYLWLVPRYVTHENHAHEKGNMRRFIGYNMIVMGLAMVLYQLWAMYVPCLIHVEGRFLFDRFPRIYARSSRSLLMLVRDSITLCFALMMAFLLRLSRNYWQTQQARLKAEKRMLLVQLSPHFLLNTLNNIYALIQINPEQAQDTVHRLSRMLSYVLYETQQELTTLDRGAKFLEQYVTLMKLRMPLNVSVSFIHDHGDMGQARIAPMLVQPLVENAFKHGVTAEEPCFVNIRSKARNGTFTVRIENSNHPKQNTDRHGHGIGLSTTRHRLRNLYPGRHTLSAKPSADGKTFITELIINDLCK